MYRIIGDGARKYMSTVIGICGTNFCSLCADSRRVVDHASGWDVADDETQKIFKINDRVLFGAVGVFETTEGLTAPFDVYPDKDAISVRMAYKAVSAYIERNVRRCWVAPRWYIVGGKDNKGDFCLYEIHLNGETGVVDVVLRKPAPPVFNFAMTCGLPPAMLPQRQKYMDLVEGVITSSRTHGEMLSGIGDIIRGIAAEDMSVGGEVMTISVF